MVNKNLLFFTVFIKHAILTNKDFIVVKTSRLMLDILKVLYKERLIEGYTFRPSNSFEIIVWLRYINGKSFIRDFAIYSTSGQRHFLSKNKARSLGGRTLLLITTSKDGVFLISPSKRGITNATTLRNAFGGEVLAQIFF